MELVFDMVGAQQFVPGLLTTKTFKQAGGVIGRAEGCDLRILGQRYDATGQDLRFSVMGRAHLVRLPLIGGFQAENVLAAAGLCIATGEDAAELGW